MLNGLVVVVHPCVPEHAHKTYTLDRAYFDIMISFFKTYLQPS